MDESKENNGAKPAGARSKRRRAPVATPLFGSAGMAASGMLPRRERKRPDEPRDALPEPEDGSESVATAPDPPARGQAPPADEAPPLEAPSSPAPLDLGHETPDETLSGQPDDAVAAPSSSPLLELKPSESDAESDFDSEGLAEALAALNLIDPKEVETAFEGDPEETRPANEAANEVADEVDDEVDDEVANEVADEAADEVADEAADEVAPEAPFALFIESSLANRHRHLTETLLAGSHVYCEHPVALTLREADELLALSESRGLRLTPDLPWRLDPALRLFHAERESLLGELLALHVYGASDRNAGGRDLLLNGPCLFDVVRWFVGDIAHCQAEITEEGMPVIAEDALDDEASGLGLLLGTRIEATFAAESGVQIHCHSDSRRRRVSGPMGIEFVGQEGRVRWFAGPPSRLSLLVSSNPEEADRTDCWEPWPGKAELASGNEGPAEEGAVPASCDERVQCWLAEPFPGELPEEALLHSIKALEMVHAVWQAGVTKRRAYLPLSNRLHPLAEDSRE